MSTVLHSLATNLWWPFIGGALAVAAAVAVKAGADRVVRWMRGRRT